MNDKLGKNIDVYFFTLVTSLQAAAWQQLGKIASPITGKVERNLPQAQLSIDMLNMIAEKSKGNLTDEESRMISGILYELRMNYVDESNKPVPDTPGENKEPEPGSSDTENKSENDENKGSEN